MQNNLIKKILELDDIKTIRPDFAFLKLAAKDECMRAQSLIFDGEKTKIRVLTTNNFPDLLNKFLTTLTEKGYKPELFYTDQSGFNFAMNWYRDYQQILDKNSQDAEYKKNVSGTTAEDLIKKLYQEKDKYEEGEFIRQIIRFSFQSGASDLHFQPDQSGVMIRLRRDGVLKKIIYFTHEEFKKYLFKLKFMSGVRMNVDFMPQDGRFEFETEMNGRKKQIDVRVSFLPGLRGEGVVMRFLDAEQGLKTFPEIGFSEYNMDIIEKNIKANYGMILVTGPTGSGKTTTLYSILSYLNDAKRKIITLEDPVEYELPGIEQSQINYNKGYTYEEGLKAVLRHDPNVILVGEIRTLETAEIAINAALTGHLVLSTLHTNSAIEAINRLLNLGVKPFMLAPAINMIIGQRLIRKLDSCKLKKEIPLFEQEEINKEITKIKNIKPDIQLEFDGSLYQPVGCDNCDNDGYKGRVAVMEVLDVDDDIKNYILQGRSNLDIYELVAKKGYLTMQDDSYIKILKGITNLQEIRRAL